MKTRCKNGGLRSEGSSGVTCAGRVGRSGPGGPGGVLAGVLLAVGMAWAVAGCGTMHRPHPEHGRHAGSGSGDRESHGSALNGSALMCDRCRTTWVLRPGGAGRLVRYTPEKVMVCPDCQSAAETWLKTGVFKHSCRRCGDRMTCEPARRP